MTTRAMTSDRWNGSEWIQVVSMIEVPAPRDKPVPALSFPYQPAAPRTLPRAGAFGVVSPKRPAKSAESSATLKAALTSLDATAAQVNTLAELRAWRIAMAKKFIRPTTTPKGKK